MYFLITCINLSFHKDNIIFSTFLCINYTFTNTFFPIISIRKTCKNCFFIVHGKLKTFFKIIGNNAGQFFRVHCDFKKKY